MTEESSTGLDGDRSGDSVESSSSDETEVQGSDAGHPESDTDDSASEKHNLDSATLRRQALFVGVTFVGMVGGLLGSLLGWPDAVVWGAYGCAYVFGGWYGLKESIRALKEPAVEIDLLMVLAALGALVIGAPFEGAILLFLFSLATVLEGYAFGRSRQAIASLAKMRPDTAQVIRDGEELTLPVEDVECGDIFVVRPGERLPLDGIVETGESTVDQSSLTGESVPVPKEPGEEVFGGTINETGSLEIRVTREADESAISRLIEMVEEAQGRQAPTQQLIDRLEQPYVLGVFAMTIVAIGLPLVLWDAPFDSTFYRAMTLMVAASPCAVIISTPAAVLSGITAGARQGVLFKGGEHVERAAQIDAVAFDKTGTLTTGNTQLTDLVVRPDVEIDGSQLTEDHLLGLTAGVQARSEHHLAEAVVEAARDASVQIPTATGFSASVGKGVRATIDGRTIHIGNRRYFETEAEATDIEGVETGLEALRSLEAEGKTSVLVVAESQSDWSVLGWLAFSDTIREDAAETIQSLRDLGVEHIVMLTGDNERVAQYVAGELGIDEVRAELLPEEKVAEIEALKETYAAVAMVGDGVNDAPALATADISVGMGGAGTDVALETADIVLMSDALDRLPYALSLSRETRKTLHINFAIAFGAIFIMLVAILTAGIPLPVAVVGHEGSTVLVALIGLRLLGFDG